MSIGYFQPEPPPQPPPAPPSRAGPPWPLVALCAWLVPGIGHALIGERQRAWTCSLTLLALFTAGLLVGGIGVVDRRNNPLWFGGQALLGPIAFLADALHDHLDVQREERIADYAREHRLEHEEALHHMLRNNAPLPFSNSIGRPHEIGVLYCAVAGALNLLVILDAVSRSIAQRSKLKVQG